LERVVTVTEASGIFAETNERVTDFSIGFVKIKGEEDDALPAGSGTLVTAGGRHAILTADHVLDALPNKGEFGLILPTAQPQPQLHRFRLEVNNVEKIRVAKASCTKDGPDLGLVLLAGPDVSRLGAKKSFFNLDKRRDRMLSTPPKIELGGWFLVGVAGEWTTDLPLERGLTRIKGFRGLCGAGVVSSERKTDEHDYLNFETKYDEGYQGPESYQGFSGGGLWQAILKEEDGKLGIKELLLSGVTFYQSGIVGDIRTIYCHGRRSVYESAFNTLTGK
jgi:hypothetical protein